MPNYFTDDPKIFEGLITGQDKAIVVGWENGCEPCDMLLDKVGAAEEELGCPVFVVDADSCPKITERLKFQGFPETIVFSKGEEVKRIEPGDTLEDTFEELKKAVSPPGSSL